MAIGERVRGIQHLGLPTRDFDGTVEFYESLGFALAFSTVNDGNRVGFLQLGTVCVETYESTEATGAPGAWEHVALNVDDVDAVYKEILKAGRYTICEDCRDGVRFLPFWQNGVRFFTIQGPNGEKIEFSQML